MKYILPAVVLLFFTEVTFAQAAIDPIFIPPTWLQDLLLAVKSLPVVGPYVVEFFKWVGVASVVLTSICAALIASLKVLGAALKLAKLEALAAQVETFQNSKVVFYLKYLSNFNAQKVVKS